MRWGRFVLLFLVVSLPCFADELQYSVEVQVVDLQVSVCDKLGNYITDVQPEDFIVTENDVAQEVLDVTAEREPFSIGIVLDTSSSMESSWRIATKATEDFVASLRKEDEFFVLSFDDDVKVRSEFAYAGDAPFKLGNLHYGNRTAMFEGIINSIVKLSTAHYPRRALFIISDGMNTWGPGDEKTAREMAQKTKTVIYSLIVQSDDYSLFNPLVTLPQATGGTYFLMEEQFPRIKTAYEKIASDLAHRMTLYYRSHSDYSATKKPVIKIKMRNPDWRVQYQKAYYPESN
jgi:VWFA-related protein